MLGGACAVYLVVLAACKGVGLYGGLTCDFPRLATFFLFEAFDSDSRLDLVPFSASASLVAIPTDGQGMLLMDCAFYL